MEIYYERRLSRAEASAHLLTAWGIKRSPRTLANIAVTGGGPAFEHAGRDVLYRVSILDTWAASLLSPLKTSTSDQAEAT
jgi:hypothetical protein